MTVIKVADDKQPQIDALNALLSRTDLDAPTRSRIEGEIRTIRAGMQGEKDAAYEIDFHYGPAGRNHVVIHDLRLEFKGRVAQIDHLIINRAFDVWVCESKSFSQGVKIDEHGEWYRYGGRFAAGVPSPVKQNARHVEVLRDLFDSGGVRLPRRFLTMKPNLMPVVLISNKARIDRPRSRRAAAGIEGLDTVIKVERLVETINKSIDTRNPVLLIAKAVGVETITELGKQLVALHKPESVDWFARFGIHPGTAARQATSELVQQPAPDAICEACGRSLTPKVLQFLMDNAAEFDTRRLCFDCQRAHRRSKRRTSGSASTAG